MNIIAGLTENVRNLDPRPRWNGSCEPACIFRKWIELTTIQAKKQKEESTKLQWIVEGDPHYHVVDKAFLKLKNECTGCRSFKRMRILPMRPQPEKVRMHVEMTFKQLESSLILCKARIKGRNCCEHDPVGQPKLHSLASETEKHVRATCATTSQIRTTTQDTTSRNKQDCSIRRQRENIQKVHVLWHDKFMPKLLQLFYRFPPRQHACVKAKRAFCWSYRAEYIEKWKPPPISLTVTIQSTS